VQATVLISLVLPCALFLIMLGLGMSLKQEDFTFVWQYPKAFFIGLSAQMLLLPLVSLLVISFISLPPMVAMGLMILSFCPGGSTSNLFSYLARGDLALSISLTAIISLICPFTIPIFTNLSMNHLLGQEESISLPIVKTIVQLLLITVLPVVLGLLLHYWKPKFCEKTALITKVLSVSFLLLIIAGIVKSNWSSMQGFFEQAGLSVLLVNLLAMSGGFILAFFSRLSPPQTITIVYEVGIQNGTTALLITSTLLQNDLMSIAPIVYSLLMFVTATFVGVLLKKLLPQQAEAV